MPRRGHGTRRRRRGTLDQLEVGARRLAIIERLTIDVATVLWLIASLVLVLFLGAVRSEAAFISGLALGWRWRR